MKKKQTTKYQKQYVNARKRILYRKRRAEKQGLEFNIPIPKTYSQLKKEGYKREQFIKESKNLIKQTKKIDNEFKQQIKYQEDEVLDLSTIDILTTIINEIPDSIQGYTGRGKSWVIESGSIRDNLLNVIHDRVSEAIQNDTINPLLQYYESITDTIREKIDEIKNRPPSDQYQAEITLVHIATLIKGSALTHSENEWFTNESERL